MAGCVIVRATTGRSKRILLISLEGETGTVNVIVMQDLFDENRPTILGNSWFFIEGPL
jgi:hypothetical protein